MKCGESIELRLFANSTITAEDVGKVWKISYFDCIYADGNSLLRHNLF